MAASQSRGLQGPRSCGVPGLRGGGSPRAPLPVLASSSSAPGEPQRSKPPPPPAHGPGPPPAGSWRLRARPWARQRLGKRPSIPARLPRGREGFRRRDGGGGSSLGSADGRGRTRRLPEVLPAERLHPGNGPGAPEPRTPDRPAARKPPAPSRRSPPRAGAAVEPPRRGNEAHLGGLGRDRAPSPDRAPGPAPRSTKRRPAVPVPPPARRAAAVTHRSPAGGGGGAVPPLPGTMEGSPGRGERRSPAAAALTAAAPWQPRSGPAGGGGGRRSRSRCRTRSRRRGRPDAAAAAARPPRPAERPPPPN
ncbi:basic salivary proline-rich protein 2-like [Vidua chalybeata]|uniref:basic salivary proline-rich protein 2-like n=1 Tax=Vidua chalybeata TaxID=81927 RepID=UPI0023A90161|nr:basic salivary proline-rich protein 2-like [Vidua chalybeata]